MTIFAQCKHQTNRKVNLYIRYFDDEAVVKTPEEAYQFLKESLQEQADEKYYDMLKEYYESSVTYTKRVKVRPRVYFVAIKTEVETIEEFKERGKQLTQAKAAKGDATPSKNVLTDENPGWYEGTILFKRVIFNVNTNKNEYVNTEFVARAKAHSPADLYQRICEHLTHHPDIDPRSQMPSMKGKNFTYKFLGMELPE